MLPCLGRDMQWQEDLSTGPQFSGLFVRICFNFTSDQKISASQLKGLMEFSNKVIMPASLRVVPQIHLEDCSNTHHWGAKGVSDNMVDHHCHPQLHSFQPSHLPCTSLMLDPIPPRYISGSCVSCIPFQGVEELWNHDPIRSPCYPALSSSCRALPHTLLSPAPRRIPFLRPSIKDNCTVGKATVLIMKVAGLLTEKYRLLSPVLSPSPF